MIVDPREYELENGGKERRRFEKSMRALGWDNEKFKRPVHADIYFHHETSFAWRVWQAAKRDSE